MKKFFGFIICTLLISAHGIAQGNTVLSLQQCVQTGIANNLAVGQSRLQMQTDEINWKQARLNLLPDLNGTANHGINQGRSIDPFSNAYINQQVNYASYGASSSVLVFNGLSAQNLVKQDALAYKASVLDWQQSKDNLTINIILAYLQVLSNEDLLLQLQNQAALTGKQVDRLDVLNKQGAIAPPSLYDLKGQYADDRLSIINTENALETSKISLCQLMNIPYDKNMQLEKLSAESFTTKYDDKPENIYQTALKQFAQVKAVEYRQQSAVKGVKVARGRLFPYLSFNANVNTNYSNAATQDVLVNTVDVSTTDYVVINGSHSPVFREEKNFSSRKISYNDQLSNNVFTSFSLNLSIPVFNSLQARNRIRLAQIAVKNADLTATATKTQLQQSIEQAYVNLTSALERYKTGTEQVAAYAESFRAAEVKFNAGVGTSIDYLIAKNNVDRATVNLLVAKYDYVLRTKILDYYQGKQLW